METRDYLSEEHDANALVGRTIEKISLLNISNGRGYTTNLIRFNLDNEDTISFEVVSDCCSEGYIHSIVGVKNLIGHEVTEIKLIFLGEKFVEASTCCKYYGLKIYTNKGFAIIDYRNVSNGYYGSDLEIIDEQRIKDFKFHGLETKITELKMD